MGQASGSAQGPDLTIAEVDVWPWDPMEGEPIEVWVEVENEGDRDAGAFNVTVLLAGEPVAVGWVDGLQPGEREQVWIDRFTGPAGEHELRVVVDPEDHVGETVETNNAYVGQITIEPRPQPNLVVSGVHVGANPLVDGDRVRAHIEVENTGGYEAGRTQIEVHLDEDPLMIERIGPIYEGDELEIETPAFTATTGTHHLTVAVDTADEVNESDESDNRVEHTFEVLAQPPATDLSVDRVELVQREEIFEGTSLRPVAYISNDGAASGPVVLSFAIGGEVFDEQTVSLCRYCSDAIQPADAWVAKAGLHTLTVSIDATDAVGEPNEQDNVGRSQVQVLARADPAVTGIQVDRVPAASVVGTWIKAPWVLPRHVETDLANLGQGQLHRNFSVQLEACPANATQAVSAQPGACELLLSRSIEELGPGDTLSLETSWDTQGKAGEWELCAWLVYQAPQDDPSNDIRCETVSLLVETFGLVGLDVDG